MKKVINIVISLILAVVIWQLVCVFGKYSESLLPSPLKVMTAFSQLVSEGLPGSTSKLNLSSHISISLVRFLIGYFTACISGILLGLVFGCFPKVFEFINPVIQIVRPIAPVAFLPFIVLWFGIGNLPAIVIIFIAGFFTVLLSTVLAVGKVDSTFLKVARNYELSSFNTIRKVIFPAIFNQIITSLHLALGTSWIFLVSGEMVGAQSGLGFLIMDTKNCMRMDSLVAVILTIGIIGFLLDSIMKGIELLLHKHFGYGEGGN